MSRKHIVFVLRQAFILCMVGGLIAIIAAARAEDVTVFAGKVVSRILDNIEWLALLPANHAERFFVAYLALTVVIALVVIGREAGSPPGWRARLSRVFSREVFLHRSALVDYSFVLSDRIFTPAMLGTRLFSTAVFAGWIGSQLSAVFGEREPLLSGTAAAVVFTVLFALGCDLADYLQHRIHHESKLLWQFHRLHHSAEVLTPLTAYRVHPFEQVSSVIVTTLVVGCVTGCCGYWLTPSPQPITFMGMQLLMIVLYTVSAVHLRHSHIWLNWSPTLSHFLISPAQHQIHHSLAVHHWDKNYGNVLAVWDWMFGSLYVPRTREALTYGLPEGQPHPTLIAAYIEPPQAAWRVVRVRLRQGARASRAVFAAMAQIVRGAPARRIGTVVAGCAKRGLLVVAVLQRALGS